MRDTTLNTIAITIFSLTMASLLGPMVHLSPVVPAVGVVAIVGLVTVDQLGLQGRMGHVFTDWLAWAVPEQRQRVITHEAGHLLVAVLLEIAVVDYALTTWEAWQRGLPGQGGVIFDPVPLTSAIAGGSLSSQWVDRYCQVWMAGIAAEQLIYGQAQGGQDDYLALQLMWQQLDRPVAEGSIKQRWALLQAKALLERHRPLLETVADAMANRQSAEECRKLIFQAVAEL